MCELLVGLPDINVLAVDDRPGDPIRVVIESRLEASWCPGCGCRARVKDRPTVALVDLPCFGRPGAMLSTLLAQARTLGRAEIADVTVAARDYGCATER